jgi:hypothetical protein
MMTLGTYHGAGPLCHPHRERHSGAARNGVPEVALGPVRERPGLDVECRDDRVDAAGGVALILQHYHTGLRRVVVQAE